MRSRRARASFLAGFIAGLLALLAATLATGAQQDRPNGAGLVIRHGDGTLIYAYVEFEGESISGEDLLVRSGVDVTVAPFGGFGAGICAIDNEGCPADDCWCESYSSPAYYWHYFAWNADGWGKLPHGASSRELRDGDIDGWSWTAGEPGLPAVSIDEIARLNGFERGPPPTPPPAPTGTPTATAPPEPSATAAATQAPTGTATQPATATLDQPAARTPSSTLATATATATSTMPDPTATETSRAPAQAASATSEASPTATRAGSGSGAVIVRPSAMPEPLVPAREQSSSDDRGNLLLFSGFALAIALIGGLIVLVRMRGTS
jgi:hypothetical protein